MRRRQVAIALSLLLVLGISGALYFGFHGEPSSHGYSLSQLLATYLRISEGYLTKPGWQDTRAYIREIGTNGLPQLFRWMSDEYPPWKGATRDAYAKFPVPLQRKFVRDWLDGDRERFHLKAAAFGFEVLGPLAAPAVPELERMTLDSSRPDRAARALAALKCIGKPAVPALVNMAALPTATNRFQSNTLKKTITRP